MKTNKRKFQRFDTFLSGRLRDRNKILPLEIPIRNASREGLCFSTRARLREGTNIQLEITLPGELVPIFTEAEVQWCRPAAADQPQNDVGVRIRHMDAFDRSRLLDVAYEKWLHDQRR